MKILHLSSEYPPASVYGLGRFVHGLARAQAALGHEVHVLTNSCGGAEDDVVVDGVHLHRIAFPNPPRPPCGHSEVLQFNHGLVSRFLDRRERLADADVICTHDWLTVLAGREISLDARRPIVFTVHDEINGKRFGVVRGADRLTRNLEARGVVDACQVIANSQFTAESLRTYYAFDESKLSVVLGAVDPTLGVIDEDYADDLREALGDADELLVAYVGRLDPEKGVETLADSALSCHRDGVPARFVFAGSGQLREALEAKLEPLGPRARFLGYLAPRPLRQLYRAADLVVVPSLYEPLGLVAAEAMACGTPVVVADSGGLPELVDEDRGWTFAAGDDQALAEQIGALCANRSLSQPFAARSLAFAQEHLTWARAAEETAEVYARAVSEPRLPSTCEVGTKPLPPMTVIVDASADPLETLDSVQTVLEHTNYPGLALVVVAAEEVGEATRAALRAYPGWQAACGTLVVREPSGAPSLQAWAPADGLVCLMAAGVEIPPESSEWLASAAWVLQTRSRAQSVAPTLRGRGDATPGALSLRRQPQSRVLVCSAACLAAVPVHDVQGVRAEVDEGARAEADDVEGARAQVARGSGEHWQIPSVAVDEHAEGVGEPARLPATVVMVVYDNADLTRAALESLDRHTRTPCEWVLVDNGSGPAAQDVLRCWRARHTPARPVRVLRNATNRGYPAAANQGIEVARGEHVVLLNNDTEVRPGWLAALLAEAGERVGLVAAKILNFDGSIQSAGGIEHQPDGGFEIPCQGQDRLAPGANVGRALSNAGGPAMLLTRGLLDAVGGFDEAFSPGYFEDSDLSLRARAAGFTLRFAPRAEVYHHGKATSGAMAARGELDFGAVFGRNQRRFYERHAEQLAVDALERSRVDVLEPSRLRIALCYHRDPHTTAAYCEDALRAKHDVVTVGRDQDVDIDREVSVNELLGLCGGADLVLSIEGATYLPTHVEEADCATALWLIDNHLHARGERPWHLDAARGYDAVFVAQPDYQGAFAARQLETAWLPLACDPTRHQLDAAERDLDLVFVGHVRPWHARRRELLDALGQRFDLTVRSGVFGDAMARLHARARVAFNCSLNGDLNMRVYEALASGALLVTDHVENGLGDLFGHAEHLLLYRSQDEAAALIQRALNRPRWAREIADRGQRLVTTHHTYAHRMRQLVQAVAPSVYAKRSQGGVA